MMQVIGPVDHSIFRVSSIAAFDEPLVYVVKVEPREKVNDKTMELAWLLGSNDARNRHGAGDPE